MNTEGQENSLMYIPAECGSLCSQGGRGSVTISENDKQT